MLTIYIKVYKYLYFYIELTKRLILLINSNNKNQLLLTQFIIHNEFITFK